MDTSNRKVGDVEIILIILSIGLGERLVSLPRVAVDEAGYGGVASVFLGGLLALVVAYLFAKLSLNFPDKTITEYSQIILGKVIGKAVILTFLIYFFIFGAIFLRRIPEFIKQVFLYSTPLEVIMITFIFVSGYCAAGGIPIYAKTSDILMGLALTLTTILMVMSIPFVKYQELLPALQIESFKKINLFNLGLPAYVGIEIIPFLVPFMKYPKNIKRNSNIALLIISIYYTLDVILTMGILGESALRYQYYPVFDAAKEIYFPVLFDLRVDILFASLWILLVYLVMVGYHYLSSVILSKLVGLKSHSVFVFLFIPLFYVVSLLPQNLAEMDIVLRLLENVWLYGIVVMILFIYLVGIIRKKVKI